MAVRHLYLVRHAEPGDDGELTERGARQAELLGRRLSDVPLTSVLHGPLARAAATARLVAQQVACDPPVAALEAAGDYVPYVPAPGELDPQHEDVVRAFFADISPVEAEEGTALAAEAVRLLTGPERGEEDVHHLVVTHAFAVGHLVARACAAPLWRWLGMTSGHAALTVLRYFPDRPPAVVAFNDMSHLPLELRWTGFPDDMKL